MFFRFALSRTPVIPIGVIQSPAFVRRRIEVEFGVGPGNPLTDMASFICLSNTATTSIEPYEVRTVVRRMLAPCEDFGEALGKSQAGWKRKRSVDNDGNPHRVSQRSGQHFATEGLQDPGAPRSARGHTRASGWR